jgi:hypothetical protein
MSSSGTQTQGARCDFVTLSPSNNAGTLNHAGVFVLGGESICWVSVQE